eukprot:CAMPEP_0172212030 /NCGR_PEP_ID=MMETSP1050-20130122/36752_1 /TAXON_ID=233186 /ORGANISM="Cryptomonas curvata, Strain CCAP979/52" /LENGTH=134 /DNA_ID=CAMNT_0012892589 /DNA_START=120 /DNA_END=524 /DNA_ORIENTATION=-
MGVGSSKNDDAAAERIEQAGSATTVSMSHGTDTDQPKDDEEKTDHEQDMEVSEVESSDELSDESVQEENELEPERRPGLIPFTSVAIDNSFSDDLLENALVCGWLSRRAVFERLPTDRWCAIHQNFIYELEDEF